ncbi:hypothetical protein R5H30_11755 [Sulfitobacter sp. D35]|uniref:hypothetical protein n=1 Tax=Sulfitobacter sp. D35 TaxID=3083252 RepID=UPI00296F2C0D|nr:hypothetical protein [Sulfitobacter sp. D35]MDW4498660.1 hypothetical protein [Sulfitobacter sp. D35]
MLIFLEQRLAYLATPKTGTTAVESALSGRADIVFARDRKHMPARRFQRRVAPFVAETFRTRLETVAVMRDPVAQLASWYRYRTAPRLHGTDRSTAGMSFDDFVSDAISDTPPPRADVGSQFRFLTSDTGDVLVDHLFAYETPQAFLDFLEARFGAPVSVDQRNVSPQAEARLSDPVVARLREVRAADFDLHDRLIAAGGYLKR